MNQYKHVYSIHINNDNIGMSINIILEYPRKEVNFSDFMKKAEEKAKGKNFAIKSHIIFKNK